MYMYMYIMQVDFLQQANQKLEADLAETNRKRDELQSKVNELTGKNTKICSELQVSTCTHNY